MRVEVAERLGNVEVAVVLVATMLLTRTRELQADWRGWRTDEVKSHDTGAEKATEGTRRAATKRERRYFFIY
jgi:hypothetical protein